MEDQQPEPGDLTDQAPDGDESAAEEPDTAGDDESDVADHTTTEVIAADGAAPPRRPRGRRAAVGIGAAAALFVGSSAFAGAMVQPYLVDRALVATKLEIARAATEAITTLWSYTPENIDTLPDRAAQYLTGDFAAKYRKDVDRITPANKQAKISLSTQVSGVAVSSVDGTQASALVYTNTSSTSPKTKGIPSLQYRSYQISMTRQHGRWLATELAAITRFSVTPEF
ncbi:mammalian cell entry protein [Mycobacterium sp. pUA109]|uniref:mammalian cell entry protein n=1 Tax=Mycobacterium sp. pUA109 TaxID=3238982 RepID=UPI00351AC93D